MTAIKRTRGGLAGRDGGFRLPRGSSEGISKTRPQPFRYPEAWDLL